MESEVIYMKPICVVTGGGSGMGFETARILGRTHHVILAGRYSKQTGGCS